ncbi:SDR family oxidoreductase [Baekduia soli]|uniref:SDR family oxidoreductase n=1 Tax=Baekduia soli TaxID=496014 RepID=A0A5B8U585_9ACTN|nr:SDR family NAD(P)-dependent oxidoreductase [Baekduia soli]QEC48101.1 SDR family oxidoreductase [Baekduia soli]
MLDTGLAEKVCLVTGGAKGIGLATARILAGEGAVLALADNDKAGLDAAEVGHDADDDVLRIAGDMSKRADVQRTLAEVKERFGRLDVLIHCAGIYRIAPLPDVTDEEWDAVLDVNLRSTFLLGQGAIELMREHGDGRIVLFSSFASRTGGLRSGAPYAASKAGVAGLSRHLAGYGGPLGVRVNCILPGLTMTPMTTILSEDAFEEGIARTPLRRASTADEQASIAVLLASDLTSFVHGVSLDVNGGMYMA